MTLIATCWWVLQCALLVAVLVRSYSRTDALAVYARNGTLQGVMSHDGRLIVAFSSLSFGNEKAWTANFASTSVEEGRPLSEIVFTCWDGKREFAGFGYLQTDKGDLLEATATHVVFTVPMWLPVGGAGLPALHRAWKFIAGRRRRRLGRCRECGYDLQGSTGPTCPECGSDPSYSPRRISLASLRRPASVAVTALVVAGIVAVVRLAPAPPPTPPPAIPLPPIAISFNSEAHADALALIGRQAGVPIDLVDRKSTGRYAAPNEVRASARLIDATVPAALDAVSEAVGEPGSKLSPADGRIVVTRAVPRNPAYVEPMVLRLYDISGLVGSYAMEPPPPIPGGGLFRGSAPPPQMDGYELHEPLPWPGSPRGRQVASLINLIESHVHDTWDCDRFAPKPKIPTPALVSPKIRYWNRWLLVLQTPDKQEQTAQLLRVLADADAVRPDRSARGFSIDE